MKNEKRIIQVIDSLRALTEAREIAWTTIKNYLNNSWNERLKHYIINNNEYYDVHGYEWPYLLESSSYCAEIDSGIVYVFKFKFNQGDYYILALQNNDSSNILELNTRHSNQESLSELFVYIEKQFDDINSFINLIVSKSNNLGK